MQKKSGVPSALEEKQNLHPLNIHRQRYDLEALSMVSPLLKNYLSITKKGEKSIDFANPNAVKILNQALLKYHYGLEYWDIPKQYLCPPIPGRADYIHYVADLLKKESKKPISNPIRVLDIGTGANCIYPILGHKIYQWNFVGSDIDSNSLEIAQQILDKNPEIKPFISLKLQQNRANIFDGIVEKIDFFELSICNPPFHSSPEEANRQALKKIKNLQKTNTKVGSLNFGGQNNELWCEGGEFRFIKQMIEESISFKQNIRWFTSLVSKKEHLAPLTKLLEQKSAIDIKIIPMAQGQKISRILAWRFQ